MTLSTEDIAAIRERCEAAEPLTPEQRDALWSLSPEEFTSCCRGFDNNPNAHASDCLEREVELPLFRESPAERLQFDEGVQFYGSSILQVAAQLMTQGQMAPLRGSFRQICFIGVNECRKIDAELKAARATITALNQRIAELTAAIPNPPHSLHDLEYSTAADENGAVMYFDTVEEKHAFMEWIGLLAWAEGVGK